MKRSLFATVAASVALLAVAGNGYAQGAAKRPTVKSVSDVSGAFAISHQRQRSAGSSSSAASVKMPRRRLVENLPPS